MKKHHKETEAGMKPILWNYRNNVLPPSVSVVFIYKEMKKQ